MSKTPMNIYEERLAFTICNALEYVDERESASLALLFNSLFATYYVENRDKKVQVCVEKSYSGPVIDLDDGRGVNETDFDLLVNSFKAPGGDCNRTTYLHAKYALRIVDEVMSKLAPLPNIRTVTLSEADSCTDCVICGDLHGHYEDLLSIINRFKTPGSQSFIVFNGDWVDRGHKQIECLFVIFYAFLLYPTKVFPNRGNHEDGAQNSLQIYNPCLKMVTLSYFGKYGLVVYDKLDELFRYLPLATIVVNPPTNQKYFVVHGGINDRLDLPLLQQFNRTQLTSLCQPPSKKATTTTTNIKKDDQRCMEDVSDMLWSDPMHKMGIKFNTNRHIGKLFGPDVTARFLEKNKFTKIIRSHECKPKGYDLMHNNKLITVFSASNYILNNSASVIKVRFGYERLDILTYNSQKVKSKMEKATTVEDNLKESIKRLKAILFKWKEKILSECVQVDTNRLGFIESAQLIRVLNKYVPNVPYGEIMNRLCELDDTNQKCKYNSLFEHLSLHSKYSNVPTQITDNIDLLVSIFQMIDSDKNGYITQEEFQNVCDKIFKHLGVTFTRKEILTFISKIDSNKDGHIDIGEFKQAFTIY